MRPKPEFMNGVSAHAGGEQHHAGDKHLTGTVTVGQRARERLDRTPGELPDGERETDGGDARARSTC